MTELLVAKKQTVKDYGDLVPTPDEIESLVEGTSFFPGGKGLWCGEAPHARLPEIFPERPFMFVGNYWFNEEGFRQAKERGVEDVDQKTGFWASLRAYLKAADILEEQCFFTNAFMGLTPGKSAAQGRVTGGPAFWTECRAYFNEQIRIVQPRAIIVMGDYAKELLYDLPGRITVPHPSSLRAKPSELVEAAKKKIKNLIEALAEAG